MQNDIVKPPKEAASKSVPAATALVANPAGPPAAGSSAPVQDPAAQNPPNSQESAPQLPATAVKKRQSSGLGPVIVITVLVCLALAGLAVYIAMR